MLKIEAGALRIGTRSRTLRVIFFLAELGLGRRFGITESEDHIAALSDVMRHLIVTGPDAAGLARQKAFFEGHLAPWTDALADALEGAADSRFYSRTAMLVRAFFAIERLAFDMV